MNAHDVDPSTAMDGMRKDVRQICHDLSNPLGILRMAVYFLQSAKGDPEKQAHYFVMMNESIDKMEVQLKRLRSLAVEERAPGEP
jgi:signal transduction histidine kinase